MSEPRWPASRETDAKIAEAMGWVDVGNYKRWRVYEIADDYKDGYEHYIFGWQGRKPHRTRGGNVSVYGEIPHYTTAEPYDSSAWGEMVQWLENGQTRTVHMEASGPDHRAVLITYKHDGLVGWGCLRYFSQTIGHALGCAVLAVNERLEEAQ